MSKKHEIDNSNEIVEKATEIHKKYVGKFHVHSILYDRKSRRIDIYSSEVIGDEAVRLIIAEIAKPYQVKFAVANHPMLGGSAH